MQNKYPAVMYGCETWTIKKKRIEANKLLCWRRLLRGPWTTRRSNQSILKEINPEYSLEGLSWSSNTLATWCKELVHRKRFWCWERLSRVFSFVVERGCLLWPVHFLGKTLLAFALLHSVFQGQISLYSRCFLTSYFCIPVPYNEKDMFFGC